MKLIARGSLVLAALIFAGQGFAQTTEDAPETPEITDVPAEEVDTAPEGPVIVTEKFGDWELRCTTNKVECFMYQLMQDEATNPVAEFTIVALPEGSQAAAGVTVVTPLGTLLDTGLAIQVDSGEARKYVYSWCDQSGCFARFGFDTTMLNNYKKGNVARVRLVSVSRPDQPVLLTLSLTGFTGAYNAMNAAFKEAQKPAE